jgi:uncharacterized protein
MALDHCLWKLVEEQFPMGIRSHHGPKHWRRVLTFGERLAKVTGADLEVVELFALFHDSRRENDAVDSGHGERGAELAVALHGKHFQTSPERLAMLVEACKGHTLGTLTSDPTIGTCWDADRLDLWRVGIYPKAKFMCTEEGKKKEIIAWAVGKSALA